MVGLEEIAAEASIKRGADDAMHVRLIPHHVMIENQEPESRVFQLWEDVG